MVKAEEMEEEREGEVEIERGRAPLLAPLFATEFISVAR